MTTTDPRSRRPFYASRWLLWALFGISVVVGFLLLVTTVAVAASKTIPVAGPRVTVSASPLPAETVTVTDDNSDQVYALKSQLAACNSAWREIATDENKALMLYNTATSSIVQAIQAGDASGLQDATDSINKANSIVEDATPKVPDANDTCTAD